MQDMLVKLYELPDYTVLKKKLEDDEIVFRRPLAAEKSILVNWVKKNYGSGWASEVEVSFGYQPISSFIAIKENLIIGFATYNAAYQNFFGPTAVEEIHRGKGIGKILLMDCLDAMRAQGFAYAIIGGVGPAEFYTKSVGAELIKGSNPGIYRGIMSDVPYEVRESH
ncbi:MAG: GNAT family N-acetyltransferase [Bacteroidetes bacterium]|nr:GNAT family N-acetyltransferase [Bacteroidota bacterium]